MPDNSKAHAFRLSSDDVKRIQWLRKHLGGVTKAAVVRRAVNELWASQRASLKTSQPTS
jgi:predicted DNA-binding protein